MKARTLIFLLNNHCNLEDEINISYIDKNGKRISEKLGQVEITKGVEYIFFNGTSITDEEPLENIAEKKIKDYR